MADLIKVGLDFGTHQTKLCIKRTPDEGHGEPNFEFFKFKDLKGKDQYFIPSVVQINNDDTLSYGYVDSSKLKSNPNFKPTLINTEQMKDFNVEEEAKLLYSKYATKDNIPNDVKYLHCILDKYKKHLEQVHKNKLEESKLLYERNLEEYNSGNNLYRYFKQATFADRPWKRKISSKYLSIWYISYILFCLEEHFGEDFSINMGIPTDDVNFERKKQLAVEILLSAYHMVEIIYEKDKEAFLSEKIEDLIKKTIIKPYSEKEKLYYNIYIFPEAYAGLISLTSKGKIPTGMNLTVDIGGGTTDISFFTYGGDVPQIYKYWSIQRGLNYIAELSGFDYNDTNFEKNADKEIIQKFNNKKEEIVWNLIRDLEKQIKKESHYTVPDLYRALKDRALVYNGGGSSYSFLTTPIKQFNSVYFISEELWKDENIKEKGKLKSLCHILTTSYGLSIPEDNDKITLYSFDTLFTGFYKDEDEVDRYIDKDQC